MQANQKQVNERRSPRRCQPLRVNIFVTFPRPCMTLLRFPCNDGRITKILPFLSVVLLVLPHLIFPHLFCSSCFA